MGHPEYTPPAYVYAPDLVGRDDALQRLSALVHNIQRRGRGSVLRFKQNMLSRVLYDKMDAAERATKHLMIARVLQGLDEANPSILGRHFFRAGAMQEAEPYLWQAYLQAERVGLMRDALRYFDFWVRSVTVHDAPFWERVVAVLNTDLWRSSDLYAKTLFYLVDALTLHNNL